MFLTNHLFVFFLRNSVNLLVSIYLLDLKDQKVPVSAIKIRIGLKRIENFTFPGGPKNGEGSLLVAITARMGQSDVR